ncbi:MAG TPA: cation-transporting P-type ATPase [Candidatus Paceibacterota bacterium]|nr:cation-transporting P-type ATPase [Candidatus Paceibacterota bacterium]HPT40251.1 cation-transporting P-type ATPase [Candidatus Paceibacterota bacterium]
MHKGLSDNQVLTLKEKFGDNVLEFKETATWLSILLSQLKSPFVYVLVGVALISLYFRQYVDTILVVSVLILNILMGFFQEYKAKKILDSLRKILNPKAIVIRNGQRKEIDIKELVPGDVVVIGAGDRIPADGIFVSKGNLLVSEAILTGEEDAVEKRENGILYMGTMVLFGKGIMKVMKIGAETEMGKIGKSLTEIREEKTPLSLKLEKLAVNLVYIVLIICLLIFVLGLLNHRDVFEILRMAIVLSVAAIPEGLPIFITIILALGMKKILKRRGLVKRLISIETLGSTSVICTDKTGTLTEGMMRVEKVEFLDRNKALLALVLTNEQRTSLEKAIWDYLVEDKEVDYHELFETIEKPYEESFNSEKKYAFSIGKIDGKDIAFMAGAAEIVLSFCEIKKEEREVILAKIEEWADLGLKIMGTAFKTGGNLKEKEQFSWSGLIGIADPIREGVKDVIELAAKAGIKIKIVTGDYRKTAERIAMNLGFKINANNVMEGREMEIISEAELKKRIDDIILFSRVTPIQKQRIVKVLQEKGEVVAMTGDGVNDAPALKGADIGIVVNNASDVAKEASDLILLDNNFQTIVAACEEGRLVFSNIKKAVGYALSNSFVEIAFIFGSVLLDFPTPLTIAQILWMHLICDGPPDMMLAFEPKEKSLLSVSPKKLIKEKIFGGHVKFLVFAISFVVGVLALFLFWYFWRGQEANLSLARTIAFITIAAVDLIYIFSYKNLSKPINKMENFFKNKFLFLGVAYGFVLLILAVYVPFLNKILGTVPLRFSYWIPAIFVAVITTAMIEIVKIIYNRIQEKKETK